MIQIDNPQNCCGCTACKSICPKNAISMEPDVLGFLYPKVDEEKCISCGLCEKVCAFNENYEKSSDFCEPLAFGARHKDMNEVESSRSGAAFIALSDWILDQGGCVYGAGFVEHFRVAHKRALTKSERNEFKGSKYVQSDLGNTFKQVKSDLINGRYVLYSGTACQIAGLKSYIPQKLREKLYLVDIVCHGAPSPYIWRDYLSCAEKKWGSAVGVNFRDKSKIGWAKHKESILFSNGKKKVFDNFTYLFYQHVMFRRSCSICHFTNLNRPSDITIADFWGWEKTNSDVNADDKGVSLLLVNTMKGKCLLESVSSKMNIFTAELKNCIQPNLQRPSSIHSGRISFEQEYVQHGYEFVARKYGNVRFVVWFPLLVQKKYWQVKHLGRVILDFFFGYKKK